MSILNQSLLLGADAGAAGYQISRSLRFNSSDSAYLSRAVSSSGNRRTWTYSVWVKRAALQSGTTNTYMQIFSAGTAELARDVFFFDTDIDDTLAFYSANGLAGTATLMFRTNAAFRDASAGYHIVLSVDTTQATAANRVKLYVNNTEQTFSTVNYPSQNAQGYINLNNAHYIGTHPPLTEYLSALLADIHFIDGQALTPSAFAETNAATGQWVPKAYTGSFGTNGFHLDFADNSAATATTLGKDTSGNGNNWTPNNLSVTAGAGNDSLVDTPTSYGTDTGAGGEVRGNYATWNPLAGSATLSNGNLDVATGNNIPCTATILASSGKWYAEVLIGSPATYIRAGVCNASGLYQGLGETANGWCNLGDGRVFHNGSITNYGVSLASGDILGIALDIDNGRVFYSKNGTFMASGNPATGANPSQTFTAGQLMTFAVAEGFNTTQNYTLNTGARPFAYTAPSGFKALCDTNLPAPVVAKPSTVMDVVLWTGSNTATARTISGLQFSPDLVWAKSRSLAYSHNFYDTVRGTGKGLYSDSTAAEYTNNNYGYISAFTSDGFTGSPGSTDNGFFNQTNATYAAWCFDAGSNTVSNTQGSITSQVRANPSAGFSIVSWTGSSSASSETVGHGLNIAPSMVILKNRSVSDNWFVYHASATSTNQYLTLNSTAAVATAGSAIWGAGMTSAAVGLRPGIFTSSTSQNVIMYCFAPVAGYSSFGSYTGNGSSDGPFVFCNFRPRWVMIKQSSASGENWIIYDAAREPANVAKTQLFPNLSNAEFVSGTSPNGHVDILSNGFKCRETTGGTNGSGATYVYAAFAENPFQYARAR